LQTRVNPYEPHLFWGELEVKSEENTFELRPLGALEIWNAVGLIQKKS